MDNESKPLIDPEVIPRRQLTLEDKKRISNVLEPLTARQRQFVWQFARTKKVTASLRAAGYGKTTCEQHTDIVSGNPRVTAALAVIEEVLAGVDFGNLDERRRIIAERYRATLGNFVEVSEDGQSIRLKPGVNLDHPALKGCKIRRKVSSNGDVEHEFAVDLHDQMDAIKEANRLEGSYPKDEGGLRGMTVILDIDIDAGDPGVQIEPRPISAAPIALPPGPEKGKAS